MQRHRFLAALGLCSLLSTSACLERGATTPTGNTLSLDLGGNCESLSKGLRETAPAPEPKPAPSPAQASPAPTPAPAIERRPPARPEYLVVHIQQGQTLYGLCRDKLGDGNRWREVAKLNGWSEGEAGQLTAGQAVKLPIR